MKRTDLPKLIDKAGAMAQHNMWGENAYKINMAILKIDGRNTAACTRLAKYYKLHDNITEAKNMYLKALEIDANNRGASNNLIAIERDEQESNTVQEIKTATESYRQGQSAMLKGKYTLAMKLFSRAYSLEPLLNYAVSIASAYKQTGRYGSIEKLYTQLIDASKNEADVEIIKNEFMGLRQNIQDTKQ